MTVVPFFKEVSTPLHELAEARTFTLLDAYLVTTRPLLLVALPLPEPLPEPPPEPEPPCVNDT